MAGTVVALGRIACPNVRSLLSTNRIADNWAAMGLHGVCMGTGGAPVALAKDVGL